jgi:hypothetical protein
LSVNVKRYSITPTTTQNVVPVVVPVGTSSRLEASTSPNLAGLTGHLGGGDGEGHRRRVAPAYPVLPNSLKTSTNTNLAQLTDGNLGEDGTEALAFTNPLFIDVDGGGWSPPGVLVSN